jgi:hypothetical protein
LEKSKKINKRPRLSKDEKKILRAQKAADKK